MNYQTMSTGEKRSTTTSLKKYGAIFVEGLENDFSKFDSKEAFIKAIYTYWVAESKKSKAAWVKTTDYSVSAEFEAEIAERIEKLYADELNAISENATSNETAMEATPQKVVEKAEVVAETPVEVKATTTTVVEEAKTTSVVETVAFQPSLRTLRSKKKRLRNKRAKLLATA